VKQWLSQDPILLTGTQATKAALLAAESPPVLAICTHAYFRESPRPRRGASRDRSRGLRLLDPAMPADTHVVRLAKTGEEFSLDELLFRLENPLLRCGIVLAGANRTVGADGQDGIAVGQEIIGMNLQGTDLVLLSACQTAVGPMEGRGESLEGLAHAFQMAGAKSVVAALWSVPDRQTAELTAEMFQALAQGIPVSEALRRAEVQAIQRYRTGPAPPDPWYWAALIALER
jgi:CHAT domain-containing protein